MRSFSFGGGLFEATTDRGSVPYVGDLFGFCGILEDLRQGPVTTLDPLAARNAPLVAVALAKIEEYKKNRALIASLPTQAQRDQAMAIVKKKWYSVGSRQFDLDELAERLAVYAKEPSNQFYRLEIKGTTVTVSDTRVKLLDAFRKGNRQLRKFMAPLIVLPKEVTEREVLMTVGLDAETLYNKAAASADKAMKSRNLADAAAARALAEQAIEAARTEENAELERAAQHIFEQMDELVKALGGAPSPTGEMERKRAEIPWETIALVAGAGILAVGLVFLLTKD